MKKSVSICTVLLFTLFVGACSSPTKTAGITSADIFTQVAITLTAQAGSAAPTHTPQLISSPSATATGLPISLPTVAFIPTQIPSVPTQTVANVVPPVTSGGCNNSLFVSDVTIPDGTKVAPGQAFVKTWKFQDSGTCAWTSDYQIAFTSGKAMGGATTAIGKAVSSGSNVNVSVSMVAPTALGTYTGNWRLADASGNFFGAYVYVQIQVSKDAATLTVTPTITATGDTSTPTDTPEATETATHSPTRTRTPTVTPKPSKTALPGDTSTFTPEASETPVP
jgi:hypothetical protein